MKLYRKIDLYVTDRRDGKIPLFKYKCTTQQSKTLKEARQKYFNACNGRDEMHATVNYQDIKAVFQK
jgi:hypothetical protein